MSKVFRIYSSGSDTLLDWQGSTENPYGAKAIGEIIDPDAKDSKREITSIPSPFARIDLVKNAYAEVVRSGRLRGDTIFHKIVSDSLDIAQIFFRLPKLRGKVEVIAWHREHELNQLLSGTSAAHRRVGATLSMFLRQDALPDNDKPGVSRGDDKVTPYNFELMQAIYLLRYCGSARRTQMDIIGATSPATLFFSTANDLSYLSADLQFGTDRAFDSEYASLGQREEQFIRFYFAFSKAYPDFSRRFKEVNEYLNLVYRYDLTPEQKDMVDALTPDSVRDYPELTANQDRVEINGVAYRSCGVSTGVVSDFEIRSQAACDDGRRPLVLPVECGTLYTSLTYVSGKWERTYKAPQTDARPVEKRDLPFANEAYPYLTISDFLEDSLVRVKREGRIDDKAFYTAAAADSAYCYLLPLRPLFFSYFTPEQLRADHMLDIEETVTGHVRVRLRIPVKGGVNIDYERSYIDGQPSIEGNGRLLTCDFAVALFTNMAFTSQRQAYYRAGIVTEFEQCDDYSATFWHAGRQVPVAGEVVRNKEHDAYVSCRTYVLEQQCFDLMRIRCRADGRDAEGVLVPLFRHGGSSGGDSKSIVFAIDLGTTNTHVEYRLDGGTSQPFDMDADDAMLKLWGDVDPFRANTLAYDMLPAVIGGHTLYHFPMRTALCVGSATNWHRAVYALADANLPFPYGKKVGYAYDRVHTNLKWSSDGEAEQRVRAYIDSLFMLLRIKTMQMGCPLEQTRIVWFYPISMMRNRYDTFSRAWAEAYAKYFGGEPANVQAMTESVAPYEHFRADNSAVNNIVTIDIGGGTTDIVVAAGGRVTDITSFRFAADAIFGDAYTTAGTTLNRLLCAYESPFRSILSDNGLKDLTDIMDVLVKAKSSANLASFFFSLRDNQDVRDKHVSRNVDWGEMLQSDERFKLVFVIFYTAIVYHLATLMLSRGHRLPRHIAFSGNGSKVIRVLSASNATLEAFTKHIFEAVYERPYDADGLTILQNADCPKEATCKGGLAASEAEAFDSVHAARAVLRGDGTHEWFTTETYAQVDDAMKERTAEEARRFLDFVIRLGCTFSLKKNFGVSDATIRIAQKECARDLLTYVNKGLAERLREDALSDSVEETLFFYPLRGMLSALITAIYDNIICK